MRFPAILEVWLLSGSGAPLADVLVFLDFRINQRYYFGHLIGLTDNRGHVRTSRSHVDTRFAENQQLFGMDFRVPLAECDDTVRVAIEGGAAFALRQHDIAGSGFISPEVKAMWQRARNAEFATKSLDVDLRQQPADVVCVGLQIPRLDSEAPPA